MEKWQLKIFTNIPPLETERLILRKMSLADADDVYEYSRDPRVSQYLLWYPHDCDKTTKRYLKYIEKRYRAGTFYDWAIVYKENNKMIGTCGFTCLDTENNRGEVGYVVNNRYWGMGIATEALSAVLKFGFETLDLYRIEAKYMITNSASARVMEKSNMKFEGVSRSGIYAKGRYIDVGTYSILRDEYFRSRAF